MVFDGRFRGVSRWFGVGRPKVRGLPSQPGGGFWCPGLSRAIEGTDSRRQ